jgi:hypothetical protein
MELIQIKESFPCQTEALQAVRPVGAVVNIVDLIFIVVKIFAW